MSKNLYMVPFDFTPTSRKALDLALHLGKRVHTEIKLLHIAKDKASGMQKQRELEELANSIDKPAGVEITTKTIIGNIFNDIGRVAKEEKVQLIIMGTHGKRGLIQRLFGSNAMKVITSAECPFLVVQKNTEIKDIKEIAVPIDLTKESLQIVTIAGDMAKIVDANVNILAEKQTDQILNTRLKNRISIVSKEYEDRDIKAKVELLKKSGKYDKKVVNYCRNNQMGMISLAYHSESILPQLDNFAQHLITNKLGLPVLIINSKLASALYF